MQVYEYIQFLEIWLQYMIYNIAVYVCKIWLYENMKTYINYEEMKV